MKNTLISLHLIHLESEDLFCLFYAGVKLLAEALGVQVPEDDPGEDGGDGRVVKVIDVDCVEVAHETAAHLVVVALRRSDGCDHPRVHDLHAEQLLVVVPDLVVHHLPQQLDGTLAADGVHGRQVDVVDKDDELFAKWGTIHSFPPLVQLAHDDVLTIREEIR